MAAAKPPLSELSLTGQLKHDEAPVSQFMAEFLPHSLAVQRDYLRHLAGLPHPVQPIDVQYPNWSALGHTIDYRLRLSFDGTPGPAVELGIALLASTGYLPGAPTSVGRKALIDAGRELRATLGEYLTDPHAVDDHTVTRLCFVASFFENIYRTGRIRRFSMLAEATAATTLDDLVAAVPAYAVDDIDQQLRLAERPLAQFRALPRRAKICGPTFAGSKDVTADADFILGGLLLDCKATREPKGIGREEIHQLAGYLLLDYDDEFGIDHVGLYLSRQGGLITWSVEEFLGRLGATLPLARLRAELRKHLRAARKRDQGR